MKRILTLATVLALCSTFAFFITHAQVQSCTVTGTLLNGDLTPCTHCAVTVVKVIKTGSVFSKVPVLVFSDSTTGVVTLTLPRASTAYIQARAYAGSTSLDNTGGVAFAIPDTPTATLEGLGAAAVVPVQGLTVQDEGTPLTSLVGTFNFAGPGVTATQPSGGVATITIPGGVTSFNGRIGAVVPALNDYSFSQISGSAVPGQLPVFIASGLSHAAGIVPDPGASPGTTKFLREDATWQVVPVTSVFGRTGAVVAAANDYSFSQLSGTPTTLAGYGITNGQPLNTNLTSIGGLVNAAGWLHNDGAGVFAYSTPSKTDVGLGNVTNDAQTKAAIVPNTLPSAGQFLAGNAGGTAYAPVSLSGSGATFSLSSAGVLTVSGIANASLSNSSMTIAGHSVALGGTQTLASTDLSDTANIPLLNAANSFTQNLTLSGAALIVSGNISTPFGTTGIRIKGTPGTLNDPTTSGTIATGYTDVFGGNTLTATNPMTVTNYVSAWFKEPIASTNVTLSNKYALGADSLRIGTSNQVTISNTGVINATSPVFVTPVLGVAGATSFSTDVSPQSTTQNLGSPAFPWNSSFTGNTTQYESVTQSAGLITHAALGSATNISIALMPKGAASVLIPDGTGNNPGIAWAGATSSGIVRNSAEFYFVVTTNDIAAVRAAGLQLGSTRSLAFGSSTVVSTPDTILTRAAPATLQLGAADAAAPVIQHLRTQGVVAGTSNTAGTNFNIDVSPGSGNAAGGSFVVNVAPLGASGTQQNPLVAALTINSTKQATFAGDVILSTGGGNSTILKGDAADDFFLWSRGALAVRVGATNFNVRAGLGLSSAGNPSSPDTFLTSIAAATFQLGAVDADTNALIVAQTLRTQGLLASGTADQAGKNFTIIVSPGKGTGAGGSFIVQTAPAGSTGTVVGTPATALTIDSTKSLRLGGSSMDGAASTLQTGAANGETINTAGIGLARYKAVAARTGVILQSGTYDGQIVTVINEDTTSTNSITFAVVATSHVANGVTTVINGLQGRRFIWSANATTPAWYELK